MEGDRRRFVLLAPVTFIVPPIPGFLVGKTIRQVVTWKGCCLKLSRLGCELRIEADYRWDGPPGTASTVSLAATLFQDVIYDALRRSKVPSWVRAWADRVYLRILAESGMGRLRRWAWYWLSRWFAAGAAAPCPQGVNNAARRRLLRLRV